MIGDCVIKHRGIFSTLDRHRDQLRGTIRRRKRKRIRQRLAHIQSLNTRVAVIQRIRPRAVADLKLTITVIARRQRLIVPTHRVITAINIADRERTTITQRAILGNHRRRRTAQDRCIFSTVQRDHYRMHRAIKGRHAQRVR